MTDLSKLSIVELAALICESLKKERREIMQRNSSANTGSPKLRQQCRIVECLIGRNFGRAGNIGVNAIRLKTKKRVTREERIQNQ